MMVIELVRGIASAFLVALAAFGIALGGMWVWAGFAGVVALVLADGLSGVDTAVHSCFPGWLYTLVLYLPLRPGDKVELCAAGRVPAGSSWPPVGRCRRPRPESYASRRTRRTSSTGSRSSADPGRP